MAGKKTCHVTRAHLVPDRSVRASVFPSPSSPAPKKTRRRRRRKEYGEGTRPLSFLFRSFLAHHRLSELGSIIDRNSSEIRHTNDRGCLSKGRIPKHTPPRIHTTTQSCCCSKKGGRREKTTRFENDFDAPSGDVSLRRGHADGLGGSSLGQGEHDCFG